MAWLAAFVAALLLVAAAAQQPSLTRYQRKLQQACDITTYPSLKPGRLESRSVGLEWVGVNDQYVFSVTLKNMLWRSVDGGATFTDITKLLNDTIKGVEPVQVVRIVASRANPANILFQGAGTYFWVTNNYGDTFTAYQTTGLWKGGRADLRVHPVKDDWILALVRRPDCRPTDEYETACPNDLYVTQNAWSGLTWTNITANANGKIASFVDFDWAQTMCKTPTCNGLNISPEAIFATMYQKQGDWDEAWDPDIHFIRSVDFFKSFHTTVKCGNQFELVGNAVYLAFANSCPTDINGKARIVDRANANGITLYTSTDGGVNFVQACMPVALKQEGYELLETHDGRGVIAVVDYMVKTASSLPDLAASSVYTAGPHMHMFSLSLSQVYRQDGAAVASDFAKIEGIPGVFIANTWTSRRDDEDALSLLIDDPLVTTRITFNTGGHWQMLPRPVKFNNPQCDRCNGNPECYLHLHGSSAWLFGGMQFPSVYSHPAAPGLVMASGNVAEKGNGLDDNEGLCTYLSNDGGVTWRDVGVGAHIYEYADWGGFIILARHEVSGAATEIKFSTDMGKCWSSVPLDSALLVENIRIEPDGQRPRVLVHGRACRKSMDPKCDYDANDQRSAPEGIVYTVDIASIMGSKLRAQCGEADYERWSVRVGPRDTCLLGQTMLFTRRKAASVCLNGAQYARPLPSNTTCPCSADDVECDYGFTTDSAGGGCRAIPKDRMPTCPVLQQGDYYVSNTHMRLLHGDVCSGLERIIPDSDGMGTPRGRRPHAPTASARSPWAAFLIFLLVLAAVVGAGVAWYRLAATGDQRAYVDGVGALIGTAAASAVSWVQDRLHPTRYGYGRAADTAPDLAEMNYFQPISGPAEESSPSPGNIFTLK